MCWVLHKQQDGPLDAKRCSQSCLTQDFSFHTRPRHGKQAWILWAVVTIWWIFAGHNLSQQQYHQDYWVEMLRKSTARCNPKKELNRYLNILKPDGCFPSTQHVQITFHCKRRHQNYTLQHSISTDQATPLKGCSKQFQSSACWNLLTDSSLVCISIYKLTSSWSTCVEGIPRISSPSPPCLKACLS